MCELLVCPLQPAWKACGAAVCPLQPAWRACVSCGLSSSTSLVSLCELLSVLFKQPGEPILVSLCELLVCPLQPAWKACGAAVCPLQPAWRACVSCCLSSSTSLVSLCELLSVLFNQLGEPLLAAVCPLQPACVPFLSVLSSPLVSPEWRSVQLYKLLQSPSFNIVLVGSSSPDYHRWIFVAG
ncbi:hypothetical protein RRG08_023781 [Elysia crispata]|uniref:Uncharacterized protein n=1 Tax=Elysia crispata TaxID=231223 RepID=A0AAE1DMV7_9GAST|nr:hypothetical protein RRG08_023781 [Elysia crispata]